MTDETEDLLERVYRMLRIIVVAAVILIVTAVALELQVSSRNKDITSTQKSSQEAKQAASEAKQAVEDAIAQTRTGSGPDPAKVIDALSAINRIELYLCGGPCPPAK